MSGIFSLFSPHNPFNSPNHRHAFMIDTESIARAPEEALARDVSFDLNHSLRYVSMGNATVRVLKPSAPTGEGLAGRRPWIHQHQPSCPDRKGF